jgi:hypothetical protein
VTAVDSAAWALLGLLILCASSSCSRKGAAHDADAPTDVEPDAAALTEDGRLCQRACATTQDIVCQDRLPPSACVASCLQTLAGSGACADLVRVVLNCFVASGADAFTCNTVAGATVLQPGYCTREQSNASACLSPR